LLLSFVLGYIIYNHYRQARVKFELAGGNHYIARIEAAGDAGDSFAAVGDIDLSRRQPVVRFRLAVSGFRALEYVYRLTVYVVENGCFRNRQNRYFTFRANIHIGKHAGSQQVLTIID